MNRKDRAIRREHKFYSLAHFLAMPADRRIQINQRNAVDCAFNFNSAPDRVGFRSAVCRCFAGESRLCGEATVDTHTISRSRIPHARHSSYCGISRNGSNATSDGVQKGFCAPRNELDGATIPIRTRCVIIRVCMSNRFLCDVPSIWYPK